MMDRICNAVLEKISSLASIGRYVIIAEDEFLDVCPEDTNEAELKKCLKSLISSGYIDMKYSSGNLYCVSPLKKYVPETPAEPVEEPTEKQKKPLSSFWAAFWGAAAGGAVISAIFALISYA